MRPFLLLLALCLCAAPPLAAWGRKGHQIVARLALQDLPPAPAAWFRGLEATVADHSSDPDTWKQDRQEGPRHFLDMDRYPGPVPTLISDARAQLGPNIFQRAGQVPWVIQDRVQSLAKAFQAGDRQEVALQASFLSHYVGDAHVPLHTVSNYDGQATGQRGVHSRWETGLVDRMAAVPDLRPAALEPNLLQAPLHWLEASNALVPSVLADDLAAKSGEGETYWKRYSRTQGPVVREQLARAAQHTAQLILLAWTMAGQPTAPR